MFSTLEKSARVSAADAASSCRGAKWPRKLVNCCQFDHGLQRQTRTVSAGVTLAAVRRWKIFAAPARIGRMLVHINARDACILERTQQHTGAITAGSGKSYQAFILRAPVLGVPDLEYRVKSLLRQLRIRISPVRTPFRRAEDSQHVVRQAVISAVPKVTSTSIGSCAFQWPIPCPFTVTVDVRTCTYVPPRHLTLDGEAFHCAVGHAFLRMPDWYAEVSSGMQRHPIFADRSRLRPREFRLLHTASRTAPAGFKSAPWATASKSDTPIGPTRTWPSYVVIKGLHPELISNNYQTVTVCPGGKVVKSRYRSVIRRNVCDIPSSYSSAAQDASWDAAIMRYLASSLIPSANPFERRIPMLLHEP
ncbi:hypothetical protein DBV15_01120 [Temnothorax longispinosus]|uniref:Uncharacterized protein n=1 Tax=Temnothorax longispinosus TaxID=300112 RepID=A0A4S2J9Z4_9HYME|nr:hypothetical protein DBV15_01120 [Temnothorax longispinosus]